MTTLTLIKNFYTVKVELRSPDGKRRQGSKLHPNVRAATIPGAAEIALSEYDRATVWAVEVSRNAGPA